MKQDTKHHRKCPEDSGTPGLGCSRWQCSDGHGSHHWVGVGVVHIHLQGCSDPAVRNLALKGREGRRPGLSDGQRRRWKAGTYWGRKPSGTRRCWAERPGKIQPTTVRWRAAAGLGEAGSREGRSRIRQVGVEVRWKEDSVLPRSCAERGRESTPPSPGVEHDLGRSSVILGGGTD